MKSMMRKTTLREIWQSLGRYLAIFAIVAMGVGFFAGLRITRPVMVASANAYLNEKQLYDYRLLSTLGFEEEDVAALAAKDDVRAVEGAVDADILYMDGDGNENVIRAHSLMKSINGLEIVAGRLPQNDTECVVDTVLYDEGAIGSSIIFPEITTRTIWTSLRMTGTRLLGLRRRRRISSSSAGRLPLETGG